MKLLIFADSHHHNEAMFEITRREAPDAVFHLGDYETDAFALEREFPGLKVYSVPGNCDLYTTNPSKLLVPLEGHSIFAAHGHTFYVKTGLDSIVTNALYSGADILLFGHTHEPYYTTFRGLTILNPGSVGYGRTYAVLTLEGEKVTCHQRQLERSR
ncbi:MAG: metallophosphoesterase family protein [bacterium]